MCGPLCGGGGVPDLNLVGGVGLKAQGQGMGGVSPPVGGGLGGLFRENFEKMLQSGVQIKSFKLN